MPLYAAMEREITAAFREVLGPGTEAYADLLGSLLIGVTFARHVARTGALAELTREELVGYLVPAIRALLAPAIAAAEGAGSAEADADGAGTPRALPVRYGRRQGYRVSHSPSRGSVTMLTHQPDEGVFRSVLAEDIDWEPFAAFPPSARLAVVVGHPPEPGPYVVRVRLPSGVKLMPHWHHEDRVYTVISGVFYIGLGEQFEEEKLQAYPPGAVVVLPGGTRHFHWAKSGEYVTQVTAVGPISLEYVDPSDDPRNK